jgi:2,5-furandicarboxylate decarboxylase 1
MEFREFVARSRLARGTGLVAEAVACAEIPARVAQAERGHNRALLFSRVIDRQASVVGNLFGSAGRVCQAFSVRSYAQLFRRMERAIDNPVPIRRAAMPGGDYAVTRDPDLLRLLPAIRYSQEDATPYLTSGVIVARFPASGRRHVCFARMALLGENRLLINPGTPRIRQIVEETVGRGEELEISVLIGPPVELILMACTTMPGEQDKLEVAQAMAGEHLRFSDDRLPVPASTEYVLRGRVMPQFEKEGPFGEVGGVYSVKESNPVCLVDELWERRNPVYHSVSAGMSKEHLELVSLGPRAFLERLRRTTPEILRYDIPAFGADRLAVLVAKDGFDPQVLVERLWQVPIIRGFVFVNEDVGSRSAADVLWAVLHRANNGDHFRFSGQRHPVYNSEKFFVDATVSDLAAAENHRVGVYRAAS